MKSIMATILLLALMATPGLSVDDEETRQLALKRRPAPTAPTRQKDQPCKTIAGFIMADDIPVNATSYTVDVYDGKRKKKIGSQLQAWNGDCLFTGAFVMKNTDDQIFYTGSCMSDTSGIMGGTGMYEGHSGKWSVVGEKNGKINISIQACK